MTLDEAIEYLERDDNHPGASRWFGRDHAAVMAIARAMRDMLPPRLCNHEWIPLVWSVAPYASESAQCRVCGVSR